MRTTFVTVSVLITGVGCWQARVMSWTANKVYFGSKQVGFVG